MAATASMRPIARAVYRIRLRRVETASAWLSVTISLIELAREHFVRVVKPLALNFANGIQPGGGFLRGARAQEEVLCRSSTLHQTLVDDPMYETHRRREFFLGYIKILCKQLRAREAF